MQCKGNTTEVGTLDCENECIGIPDCLLKGYYSSPNSDSSSYIDFLFSCPTLLLRVSSNDLNYNSDETSYFWSQVVLPSITDLNRVASSNVSHTKLNLIFKAENSSLLPALTDMVINAAISITIVEENPLIDMSLQPRLILQNNLPLPVIVRTPDCHILSPFKEIDREQYERQTMHHLNTCDSMQIFNSRDMVRISTKFKEKSLDWMQPEFIDLHLNKSHQDDLVCLLKENSAGFAICEINSNKHSRSLSMMAQCIIIDHVEEFSIETVQFQEDSNHEYNTLTSFSNEKYGRFVLMPDILSHVRICQQKSYSNLFKIDLIDVGIGAFESSQLFWEDLTYSGYYVYRKVIDMGVLVTELHIISEYMIHNSTQYCLLITYNNSENSNSIKLTLDPSQRKPLILSQSISNANLHIKIEVPEKEYFTDIISIKALNEQLCHLHSASTCQVESLAVITKVGKESERILVHITKHETTPSKPKTENKSDLIRFIMKCQQVHLKMKITDTYSPDGFILSKFHNFRVKYQRLYLPSSEECSELKISVDSLSLSDSDEQSEELQTILSCADSNDISAELSLLYRGSLMKYLLLYDN